MNTFSLRLSIILHMTHRNIPLALNVQGSTFDRTPILAESPITFMIVRQTLKKDDMLKGFSRRG